MCISYPGDQYAAWHLLPVLFFSTQVIFKNIYGSVGIPLLALSFIFLSCLLYPAKLFLFTSRWSVCSTAPCFASFAQACWWSKVLLQAWRQEDKTGSWSSASCFWLCHPLTDGLWCNPCARNAEAQRGNFLSGFTSLCLDVAVFLRGDDYFLALQPCSNKLLKTRGQLTQTDQNSQVGEVKLFSRRERDVSFFDLDFSCIWQEKLTDNTSAPEHGSQNVISGSVRPSSFSKWKLTIHNPRHGRWPLLLMILLITISCI